jgi:uncharacterized protein (DUF58 family)
MSVRRLLIATGFVLFALSVAELVQPGVLPLPGNELVLTATGGVALLYTLSAAYLRRRTGPEHAETPDVELGENTEVPGQDLQSLLQGFPGRENVYSGVVPTRRDGLRRAAIALLTRYRGIDAATAREQVSEGTWTDDPEAAAFLADRTTGPPLRRRLRTLFALEPYRRRARAQTTDAVAAVAGVDADEPTPEDLETAETSTAHLETGSRTRTNHWAGVSVVALACLAVGLLFQAPAVLLSGVVAVAYAAYARSTPQGSVQLTASRSVSDSEPDPDDAFRVRLTVTNDGGFCPDLRIVDGVPGSLVVTDGSPREAATLRAGESVTLSYTVRARRGTHEFGPAQVLARNLAGSTEQELVVEAETTVSAVPTPQPVRESMPLRQQPTRYAGRASTDDGGEGIEFHTVREYRPGDSMTRIDWNRRARTGELTTLEFRRERATRVVVLVDVQPAARAGHHPAAADAVERSVDATQRLFPALLADGHVAGIAAFGPRECFLPPDTGVAHRQRARELLATDPAFNEPATPELQHRTWGARLREQLPADAQLLLFSPLLDPRTVRVVREFEAHGYPTTVVSPDPTAAATPTQRLMRARRRLTMTDLRQAGVPVLDWAPGASIETVIKRRGAIR